MLNENLDRLRRDETGLNGYYTIGEAASFYKFAKMNYSLETYMAFKRKEDPMDMPPQCKSILGFKRIHFI